MKLVSLFGFAAVSTMLVACHGTVESHGDRGRQPAGHFQLEIDVVNGTAVFTDLGSTARGLHGNVTGAFHQDGVPGSNTGSPGTFEAVTTRADSLGQNGCTADVCYQVTVNNFRATLTNLLMRIDSITPPTSIDVANSHQLPPGAGISEGWGVFNFGTVAAGSTSGPVSVDFNQLAGSYAVVRGTWWSEVPTGQQVFEYRNSYQIFTVPAGVTSIHIDAYGGQGMTNAFGQGEGGLGGRAAGTFTVTPGNTWQVRVGRGGIVSRLGGYNGGGDAGRSVCADAVGGGGGGASDVRVSSVLTHRVVVAAGGGGAGGYRRENCGRGTGGGGGGGYYGGGGGARHPYTGTNATGGTQVAGGAGGTTTFVSPVTHPEGHPGELAIGGGGGNATTSPMASDLGALPGGAGGGLTGDPGQFDNATVPHTGGSGAGGSSYLHSSVVGGFTEAGVRSGDGLVIISW